MSEETIRSKLQKEVAKSARYFKRTDYEYVVVAIDTKSEPNNPIFEIDCRYEDHHRMSMVINKVMNGIMKQNKKPIKYELPKTYEPKDNPEGQSENPSQANG